MSLSHAILASLSDNTYSGYDLAKQFDGSVGFFWKATNQQIYRELRKLEEAKFINSQEIAQEGRPNKRVFSITETGKNHLRKWITEPTELSTTKEEILIKVFAGHLVPKTKLIQELEHQRYCHQERLTLYKGIEHQFVRDVNADSREVRYKYLTLRRGIRFEKEWIAWYEETINFLAELPED